MILLRSVILFCGSILLYSRVMFCSNYHEPIVQEGKPYTMHCIMNMSLANWPIHWLVDGNKVAKTVCIYSNDRCSKLNTKRYKVSIEKANEQIRSNLTIYNVSRENRRHVYYCKAYEMENESRIEILGIWNMSRTYYPPSNLPECKAHLEKGQTIRLSCEAFEVYPDIVCEPFQIYNGNKSELEVDIEYHTIDTDAKSYYSVICNATIFPVLPGEYQFCVHIAISIGRMQLHNSSACTQNLTIIPTTTMRIVHNSSRLTMCPGEAKHMTVQCDLLWWSSSETPTVNWYVDNELIEDSTILTSISELQSQNTSFVSIYNFTPNYNMHDKLVKCQVFTDNSSTHMVKASAKINLTFPPSKPLEFSYKPHRKSNQTEFSVVIGNNVSVECAVAGGEPAITTVIVECHDSNMIEVKRISRTNEAGVSFTLQKDTNCSCNAQHTSSCVIPPAEIVFLTRPSKASLRKPINIQYSISAGIVGLVALVALIAMVFYWRTRWKDSCTPCLRSLKRFKPTFSGKDTSDLGSGSLKATWSEVTPYSVVDIINQNSTHSYGSQCSKHSFSNVHPKSVELLHNNLPLSLRPLPPVPPSISSSYNSDVGTEDTSGFDVIDATTNEKSYVNSTNLATDSKECLKYEGLPPPLPPKPMWNTNKHNKMEIPLFIRDDILLVNTERHRRIPPMKNGPAEIECIPYSNSPYSVSKQMPLPLPCTQRLQIDNRVNHQRHAFTATDDAFKIDASFDERPDDVTAGNVDRDIFMSRPDSSPQRWPPPPFRARRKICNKKLHRPSKTNRRFETGLALPISSEHNSDSASNTSLDATVNPLNNVKADVFGTKDNSNKRHNLFESSFNDENNDSSDDSATDNDAESYLLSTSSSTSSSSLSTVVDAQCTDQSSPTESGLLLPPVDQLLRTT